MKAIKRPTGNFKLAFWRNERQYTQKELATIIGVSVKTYSNYECGRNLPPIQVFLALEVVFGIPVRTLYESFEWCNGYVNLEELSNVSRLGRGMVLECQ